MIRDWMIKIIYTSDVGVGAVLLQGGKDDIDLPNLLKSLTKIRKNNPQLKQKAFWCTFRPFVVLTYHNTITCINNMQNTNHRSTKWGLMLQEYILIINHITCNDVFIANVLSRVG